MSADEMKARIDALLADIQQLPTLPSIATRVIRLATNPDVDIKALADEISRDSAITASLIKLSNSAYFRPSGRIRSVQEAIVTLGLNTVKDIILIIASKGILKVDLDAYKLNGLELWDHSLLVAEMSSRIARLKKIKTAADIAYTAGLLHDTGKVVLIHFFRKIHRQIAMEMDADPSLKFTNLEKKYLGYTNIEIGGKLLRIWNFPDELVEAVGLRDRPDQAVINPELCSVVHLANILVLSAGVGVDAGGLTESISPFAINTLKIKDAELHKLYEDVPEMIENIGDLRGI